MKYSEKVSKEALLDELLTVRKQFMSMLEQMSEEQLNTNFSIGKHELTVKGYFLNFIHHDLHHQRQIMKAIRVHS